MTTHVQPTTDATPIELAPEREREAVRALFGEGNAFSQDQETALIKSNRLAWRIVVPSLVAGIMVLSGALAVAFPLRQVVPYLVKVDTSTGNTEVLQPFDNREVARSELIDKYWAATYVAARERYSWWTLQADYDLVQRLSSAPAAADYTTQFAGDTPLQKVFGSDVQRRVTIVSVTPSPISLGEIVVRFERDTVKGTTVVEPPTAFIATISFRYNPRTVGPQIELMRNPMGYEVVGYRRDIEQRSATPAAALAARPL